MFNDEIQEDVTLENDVEVEEEVVTEEETTDPQAELEKARAEAKKWEAIAKRKAKKAEEAQATTVEAPTGFDEELLQLTYKNHLASVGLTESSVQEEAIALAKKMGTSIAKIQDDPALMEVLKAKNKYAIAKKATANGTGGSTVQRSDTSRLASQVAAGKALKDDDISGAQALEMLGLKR